MPRTEIRSAVTDYLTDGVGTVPSLSTVYGHPPKLVNETDFYSAELPGTSTGAIIFIYLGPHDSQRVAVGGPHSGKKFRTYPLGLMCYLLSMKTEAQDAGVDNDAFLDGLQAWIEADRTADSAGVVFEWGEGGENRSPDILTHSMLPRIRNGGAVTIFTSVEVTVRELATT